MNTLEKIIATKKKKIAEDRQKYPVQTLEKSPYFQRRCYSLCRKLKESTTGIIAEFKRASPSKGIINDKVSVEEVAKGYEQAGASGMSVLTDRTYFNGQDQDLIGARRSVCLPLLRKDFIIDEYQIIAAKSLGADLILLIAEALSKKKLEELAHLARELGLEVLMELHSEKELDKVNEDLNLIGINNRDLKTFSVDIERSAELVKKLPERFIKISESGLSDPSRIVYLQQEGFKGFLIGENFMQSADPGKSCEEFIKKINGKL
ncbi:indole-3-glycerol phosphate synthase TrpC [Bacteroidetes bacterium endosymbiont of Geopemphigus sp.]|uniref:indole-3-glycerol phosphate synthase TrpC n=1 Tax=Bacteroidetes bacterium endosymbiont of Geopemphigus sp. TaxID=2047937 RepID=UPI000CD000E7|nr:indole-3-glycerol phosphate synthase TrpC [Bacteroidetes bacterium endosymbiont of Geopemphigus sp.]